MKALLFGHAHHQAVFGDAGVVYQNVDTTEVVLYLFHHFLGLLEVGGVRGVTFSFYAESFDFGFGFFTVFVDNEVGECYVGAFGGEFQGKGFADTTGRTGDEGGFTFE